MLSKLIKHELRATGRTMLPLLGMLPVLAILAGISMNKLEHSEEISTLLEIFLVLIFVAFFIGIIAVCAICFWMMISRFYKNLLGDEGYLMMTLCLQQKLTENTVWKKRYMKLKFMRV